MVGTPGTVRGVTGTDCSEGAPGPYAFPAVTVNVYGMPFSSPATEHDKEAVAHWYDPGLEVTR